MRFEKYIMYHFISQRLRLARESLSSQLCFIEVSDVPPKRKEDEQTQKQIVEIHGGVK